MTSAALGLLRRLAVAMLALACLSPVAWQLPDLPSLPEMLGYAQEPVPTPVAAAPTPSFQAIDSSAPLPQMAVQRPARGVGRTKTPPAQRPPRPQRKSAKDTTAGAPLPMLPPDEVPRGRYHRVEPGDTAASIATAYGLSNQWAVYDANPVMVDPQQPPVGAWLYIPHPTMSPQPRARPGQPGYSATPSGTVVVDGVWLQLAQCESSGNWAIDTGNGYYGGLQFTLQSWKAVGGAGKPNEAHPMEQIARADYLQRIQGWRAWPMCSGKLGLIPKEEADAIVERARQRQRRNGGPTVEEGAQASDEETRSGDGSKDDAATGGSGGGKGGASESAED